MKSAFRLYSWEGLMKSKIEATKIKSSANARKLGPFADEDKNLVTWVNWSKPVSNTGKKRKPYFRYMPKDRIKRKKQRIFQDELDDKKKLSESEIHFNAKELLAEYLRSLLVQNKSINWVFIDKEVSDFSLSGNLLSDVTEVVTEYNFPTPFGIPYKFDIALLGKPVNNAPIILGVIEIEKENKFGFIKCLLSKALGFPLVSVNIEDETLESINNEWCEKAIKETTKNSKDKLRRNYIYLHNMLYPIYLNMPDDVREDDKHQFVIFISDDKFDKLFNYLNRYKKMLGFDKNDIVHVGKVKLNNNESSSITMFNNEGSIAGTDWELYNQNKFLRVTCSIPKTKSGNLYKFHLVMARLLNAHFETLVGYKYRRRLFNTNPNEQLWKVNNMFTKNTIVQKNLSEPLKPILELLKENRLAEKILQ